MLVYQQDQAGHEAGLAGYELVYQHDQTGHKADLAGYELVNQHGQAGHKAGLAGYELVDQLVLAACLVDQLPAISKHSLCWSNQIKLRVGLSW